MQKGSLFARKKYLFDTEDSLMLDVLGVILGAVSVVQGWKASKGLSDDGVAEYLTKLSDLDRVMFSSKRIHDSIDETLTLTGDLTPVLLGDLSRHSHQDIETAFLKYKIYLSKFLDKLPGDLVKISSDESAIDDANIQPNVREDILKLTMFNSRLIAEHQELVESIGAVLRIENVSASSADGVQTAVKEVEHIKSRLYSSADKSILHCSSLTAFLHGQAQDAISV